MPNMIGNNQELNIINSVNMILIELKNNNNYNNQSMEENNSKRIQLINFYSN